MAMGKIVRLLSKAQQDRALRENQQNKRRHISLVSIVDKAFAVLHKTAKQRSIIELRPYSFHINVCNKESTGLVIVQQKEDPRLTKLT